MRVRARASQGVAVVHAALRNVGTPSAPPEPPRVCGAAPAAAVCVCVRPQLRSPSLLGFAAEGANVFDFDDEFRGSALLDLTDDDWTALESLTFPEDYVCDAGVPFAQ
jgi:hypothetical protein